MEKWENLGLLMFVCEIARFGFYFILYIKGNYRSSIDLNLKAN